MGENTYPIYAVRQTLCLCFADINKETNLGMINRASFAINELPLEKVIEKIHHSKANSISPEEANEIDVDILSVFPKGVFKAFWNEDEKECDAFIKDSLSKLDYKVICRKNEWTIKEFANMMAVMLLFVTPDLLGAFYNKMKDYVKETGLPFKEIF